MTNTTRHYHDLTLDRRYLDAAAALGRSHDVDKQTMTTPKLCSTVLFLLGETDTPWQTRDDLLALWDAFMDAEREELRPLTELEAFDAFHAFADACIRRSR